MEEGLQGGLGWAGSQFAQKVVVSHGLGDLTSSWCCIATEEGSGACQALPYPRSTQKSRAAQ